MTQVPTHSLGTIAITGTQQGPSYPLTAYARATVTITGTEGIQTMNMCPGAPYGPCWATIPDLGTVTITINGTAFSTTYSQLSTGASVASALASAVSSSGIGVAATSSGATITLKYTVPGTDGNGTFPFTISSATSQTQYFSGPSFSATPLGGTLTGGTNAAPTTYDAGTITATVGGNTAKVNYSGASATPQSIAAALATAISKVDPSITAESDGDVNILVSDSTGTATDYGVSASFTAYDTADFSGPSFAATAFSMGDGLAADPNGGGLIYGYYVPKGGYAANGNLVASSDSVMGDWVYGYDTLNRLTSAVNALSTTVASQYAGQSGCWAYDPFGNRALESYQTTACSTSYTPTVTYNGNNQVTKAPSSVSGFTYDAAGNVLNDGLNQYAYDGEGRLCAVKNSVSSYVQYVYDASGTRVAKGTQISPTMPLSCPAPTTANFTASALYLLDQGGDQVTELSGTGTWKHSNAWPGGHLDATYDTLGLHFHIADPLGSRRVQTNAAGVVEEWYASLPFGDALTPVPNPNCLSANNCYSEDPTEHHFTGKERDTESGNDYFGARYYASSMGRWMSPDWAQGPEAVPYAVLRDPQTLNLYSYVSNNPLRLNDPDGHHQECERSSSSSQDADGTVHVTYNEHCVDIPEWYEFQSARKWLRGHPKTVQTVGAIAIGATAISGVFDGGASELAVPEEIALEETLVEGGEVAAEGAGETAAAETAGTAEETATAEKTSGLERQIAEHEEKLADYKANPDAYDNKGILKNASPERQQSIINGRIRHLEREIEAFRKSLNSK